MKQAANGKNSKACAPLENHWVGGNFPTEVLQVRISEVRERAGHAWLAKPWGAFIDQREEGRGMPASAGDGGLSVFLVLSTILSQMIPRSCLLPPSNLSSHMSNGCLLLLSSNTAVPSERVIPFACHGADHFAL
jgi:hypothetical protein